MCLGTREALRCLGGINQAECAGWDGREARVWSWESRRGEGGKGHVMGPQEVMPAGWPQKRVLGGISGVLARVTR